MIIHLVSRVLLALMVVTGDSPAPAKTKLIASFKGLGQVCIEEDPEKQRILQELQEQHSTAGPITLTGYSDAKDLRADAKLKLCTRKKLPSYITGHERIALLRALYVFEIANAAGIPGFEGDPVFVASLGGTGLNPNATGVFLAVGRADSSSQTSRGVELTWRDKEDDDRGSHGSECPCPTPPPKVIVNVPPTQPVRKLEVASYPLGIALLGLGVGFFVAAALQAREAKMAMDPMR